MPPANRRLADCFIFSCGCLCLMDSENQENVEPSGYFRAGFSPIIQIPLQRAKSLSTRHLMGYSPQQFLDERCQACQVLTFTPPEANLPWQHMGEKAGGESHHSITGPWTPRASCVQHEDLQRLQDENLAFTGGKPSPKGGKPSPEGKQCSSRCRSNTIPATS
ncbi:hypothetical protein UPYG_G00244690 [Umbra pygmaea]|uniref:Uncharacterized protein n=1 Tax=Umbra pygmaea TaxID=75934 RepID=A0ABD0WKW6_UMBPY